MAKPLTKTQKDLIAGFTVAVVVIIAGVVAAIVLTRKESESAHSGVVTPSVSPVTPAQTQTIRLEDGSGNCFGFTLFGAVMEPPTTGICDQGSWIVDSTNKVLTYRTSSHQYCMNAPPVGSATGGNVYGGNGSNCLGVEIDTDGVIKAVDANLCVNYIGGNSVEWGSCPGYQFTVVNISS